ncbi:hypothetical protein FNH08_40450 [Streptomyces spongiae]|uniref:Lipoprotein n=1 Tax=Streptomyces spongiae TaxID=565072 RepID=A0A5N8XWX1_9ACTN|nr:hypothetical protein [Streptomyces spongiae]
MRIAAAAAGLAAALALTACSGDGGDSADKESPSASGATGSADTGGGSGSSGAQGKELAGSWLATTKGKAVALVVTGEQAAVFETGGSVCSGSAKEESGMQMLHLKCTDGSNGRTEGMVDSVSATSATITWEGGVGKETFQKAEGGQLPSGLPTNGLGSS